VGGRLFWPAARFQEHPRPGNNNLPTCLIGSARRARGAEGNFGQVLSVRAFRGRGKSRAAMANATGTACTATSGTRFGNGGARGGRLATSGPGWYGQTVFSCANLPSG